MNNILVNSVIEDNDIVYPEDCESNSESNNPNQPEPNSPGNNEKCCEKSYTIILHFH